MKVGRMLKQDGDFSPGDRVAVQGSNVEGAREVSRGRFEAWLRDEFLEMVDELSAAGGMPPSLYNPRRWKELEAGMAVRVDGHAATLIEVDPAERRAVVQLEDGESEGGDQRTIERLDKISLEVPHE